MTDAEQDEDDLDDEARDQLLDETLSRRNSTNSRPKSPRSRTWEARAPSSRARQDSKLSALKECLTKAAVQRASRTGAANCSSSPSIGTR